MAKVERYSSFEEMEKAEQAEIKTSKKSRKKKKLTTIKEFALLLRKNVVSKPQANTQKPE